MSWGESPSDFTGEPRKVFINFLIWNIKQIEYSIYFVHRPNHAIQPLMGLIDSLDDKSKKALSKQYEKLEAMCLGKAPIYAGDIEAIYREVLSYLLGTYLSEVVKGIIPAASLPTTTKKPEAKTYGKSLPDGV